jgi:xylan 1,4-beta-xylosidase
MRVVIVSVLCLLGAAAGALQQQSVTIRVDTAARKGPMLPFWAWFGHDEPNYTYTTNGKKLLSALHDLSPVPVFVRVHNLLTSGDGTHALKWGSTNVYTEDGGGRPIYDWTIVDRIVDTYMARQMKPLVQLGFMPEALSSAPSGTPYRHFWKPGDSYNDIYTGWTYAPKDYTKWEALCYEVTTHLVERYGRQAVESWWFELWNEPDIGYWSGSVGPSAGRGDPQAAEKAQTRRDEFLALYDFTVAGVRRALPTARIGGPEVTGGAQAMLRTFLQHTSAGTNAVTERLGQSTSLRSMRKAADVRREPCAWAWRTSSSINDPSRYQGALMAEDADCHRRPIRRLRGLRGELHRRTATATERCSDVHRLQIARTYEQPISTR